MAGWEGSLGVEIVALNGEDTYHAVGQVLYLERNAGRLDDIRLAVNLDGAGYREGRTEYSLYECPDGLGAVVRGAFGAYDQMVEGAQWPQGDHMIFVMNGRVFVVSVDWDNGMPLTGYDLETGSVVTQFQYNPEVNSYIFPHHRCHRAGAAGCGLPQGRRSVGQGPSGWRQELLGAFARSAALFLRGWVVAGAHT